ncbi:MAG TPA: hypothetical protein VK806_05750 [Bacteroidia bacterium]|jgi:hypothetical protein|nr:hypothetical protein [Bacteroidia bacterium]
MRKLFPCILSLGLLSCTQIFSGKGGNIESLDGSGGSNSQVNNEKLPPAQYVKWVEDEQNGLKKSKTIDDIIYTAQYKPCQYVVCEEEKKMAIADSTIKQEVSELGGMQYMNLKIELKNGSGEFLRYGISTREEYNERVNYFSFGMQKDVQLVDAGDTLPCLLFHYERLYSIAPYGTFLLAFPKGKNIDGDKTLIIFDHVFNTGIVKLFFKGSDLKNTPQLEAI